LLVTMDELDFDEAAYFKVKTVIKRQNSSWTGGWSAREYIKSAFAKRSQERWWAGYNEWPRWTFAGSKRGNLEIDDLEHAKILSICCVMMKTLQRIDGKELLKWMKLECANLCQRNAHSGWKCFSSAFYLCGRWWKQIERKTFIKGLINYIDKTQISDIYIRKLNSVNVDTEDVEVARIMQNMI
jgi:hypothetical protein